MKGGAVGRKSESGLESAAEPRASIYQIISALMERSENPEQVADIEC